MSPLVWIALLAGGAYLLTRSSSSPSSSSTCSPPQPTTVPPAVPGEYVAVAELWNDASCSTEGQPDVMPVTAQELAGMQLKVGGKAALLFFEVRIGFVQQLSILYKFGLCLNGQFLFGLDSGFFRLHFCGVGFEELLFPFQGGQMFEVVP